MGPISVDGSGQNNPNRSEGPWGGVDLYSNGGIPKSLRPDTERDNRFGLRGVRRTDANRDSTGECPEQA
jgi:hypothetical protein